MKRNKRIIIGVIAVGMLIGLVFGGKYVLDLMSYKEQMSRVRIDHIDLKDVNDGTYIGSFDAKIISATVSVSVKNGKMTDIELLEHKYERGGSAAVIIDEILKEQSLEVDAVSGATNSSKTILKAVENALKSEKQQNINFGI